MRQVPWTLLLLSCATSTPSPDPSQECATLGALADAPACTGGVCPRCVGGPSCDWNAPIYATCHLQNRHLQLNIADRTTLWCDDRGTPIAVSMEIPNQDGCPTTRWWGEDLSACDPDLIPIDCDTDPGDVLWVETGDSGDTDADTDSVVDTDPAVDTDPIADTDTAVDTDPSVDTDPEPCADTGCGPEACDSGSWICVDSGLSDSADTGPGGGCWWVCARWD